jgi:hypothetical protein
MKDDLSAAEAASSGFTIFITETQCFKNLLQHLKPEDHHMQAAVQQNGCTSFIGSYTYF